MWDTGGQQRYRPVLASCYRGALGVIIVFDLTSRSVVSRVIIALDLLYRCR